LVSPLQKPFITGGFTQGKLTAGVSITGTLTPLVFDSVLPVSSSFNVSSGFNTTTGVFTAPVTGFYRVKASITITRNAADTLTLDFRQNSAISIKSVRIPLI